MTDDPLRHHAQSMGADDGSSYCPIMPTYGPPQVMFTRGEGSWLWDADGKRYLDFLSGLAVTSLGHAHPAVAETLARQSATLLHTSNLFATEHAGPAAASLDALIGGGGQVFFSNSGAEANECAIKLARHHFRASQNKSKGYLCTVFQAVMSHSLHLN